jgi:hypothetical protein
MSNAIGQYAIAGKNTVANRDKFQIWMTFYTIATPLADYAVTRDADF